MTKRFELECCGEPVTMVVDDDGVEFIGWDEDAELALVELGFSPSLCLTIRNAILGEGATSLNDMLISYSSSGDSRVVALLIAAGANIESIGRMAYGIAVKKGYADVVMEFINAGISVGSRYDHELEDAARKGHLDIVEMLLDHGAAPGSALFDSASAGNVAITKTLIDHSEDRKMSINYAFIYAARGGHTDLVGVLLNEGADVHIDLSSGRFTDQALQDASENGHLGVVKVLLDAGANVYAEDIFGSRAALRRAKSHGHYGVVSVLEDRIEEHG